MGYTFDIELDTDQPFVVELDQQSSHAQVLSGWIVLQLSQPEKFKVVNVAIYGQIGVALNVDTKPVIVRERLLESIVDVVAANDTEGHGTIEVPESGTQVIPFRIDIPRPQELPPTLINKLDTHYIDWKYEIHATLHRDSIFATDNVVKHELILRRSIAPKNDTTAMLTALTDMPGQFRSKLTAPSEILMGQDNMQVTVEMKAWGKEYMIREIDCAVVQTEDINYSTRFEHPKVDIAHESGVPCQSNASRLVSGIKKISNDGNDMDFGREKPLTLDLHLDNNQLIPTERGLDWLEISHVLQFTVRFMDVNLDPIVMELPLFVGNEERANAEKTGTAKAGRGSKGVARLIESLTISRSDKDSTHEAA